MNLQSIIKKRRLQQQTTKAHRMSTAGILGTRSKRQPQGALKCTSYSPEKAAAARKSLQNHQICQQSDQVVNIVSATNKSSNNTIVQSCVPDQMSSGNSGGMVMRNAAFNPTQRNNLPAARSPIQSDQGVVGNDGVAPLEIQPKERGLFVFKRK